MNPRHTLPTLLTASLLALAAHAAAAGIEPGQWEFSVKTDVEGLPPAQHPLKLARCISNQDADNLLKLLPLAPGATPDTCSVTERHQTGSKLTYRISCPGMPSVTTTGEATLAGAALNGAATSRLDAVSYHKQLQQSYSGKRTGPCR